MNSKRIDLWTGSVLGVFSVVLFLYAGKYAGTGVNQYGPNFFPQVLAAFLFISSITLLVRAFLGKALKDLDTIDAAGLIRAAVSVGISIVYLFVMQLLGFFLSTIIFLFVLMTYFEQKGVVVRIISSIAVASVIYAIFAFFLKIPLPEGIF